MKVLQAIFLYPVSLIYGLVVNIRNLLFDFNIFKSHSFDIPIISIGNITVGGTGKTPTTEYLIRSLQNNYNIAVLSRGYKRKTKGFILANKDSSVEQIGDESFQIKQKFPSITVAVAEKRVVGIKKLQEINIKLDLIILDDAFQHRKVKPGFSILLIDYTQDFFNDYFLPFGRKRDSIKEFSRANIVLVTKAPKDIKPIDMRVIATDLKLKAYQSLYFSCIKYDNLKPVFEDKTNELDIDLIKEEKYSIILVTGIGNYKPLLKYCKSISDDVNLIKYPDHHNYTKKDIENIFKKYNSFNTNKKIIITTEKDAVKIKMIKYNEQILKDNFYFFPIKISILNNEAKDFEQQIIKFTKKDQVQYKFLTTKNQY